MTASSRVATSTASTKRSGGIVNGLEVGYVEHIASLSCTPPHPVDPELTLGIEGLGFREVLQTEVFSDLDILEGDVLVIASTEYTIRSVAEWEWKGGEYLVLIIEEVK
jgi:hypothetical protein